MLARSLIQWTVLPASVSFGCAFLDGVQLDVSWDGSPENIASLKAGDGSNLVARSYLSVQRASQDALCCT